MQKKSSRRPLDMKAIGDRVRELIRLQDSSVGCFADRIGVSRNTLYRLTCEGLMPSLQTIVDISDMLGCSVDFLLGLEKPEESIREAYHTAALNILEYREQMSRKQKLLPKDSPEKKPGCPAHCSTALSCLPTEQTPEPHDQMHQDRSGSPAGA